MSVNHPPDLCVTVRSKTTGEVVTNFTVNSANAALTQRVEVRKIVNVVTFISRR